MPQVMQQAGKKATTFLAVILLAIGLGFYLTTRDFQSGKIVHLRVYSGAQEAYIDFIIRASKRGVISELSTLYKTPFSKVEVFDDDEVVDVNLNAAVLWDGKTKPVSCQILINGEGPPLRTKFTGSHGASVSCNGKG